MELDRKAFHFDLDNESVERFYTGKKNPWSDIQDFLESHCFEKPQYSGYESAENIVMSYQRAYGTIDEMMNEFPWFQKCLKAATFTEIGESYDVKEFLENGMQLSLPLAPTPVRSFTLIWERLRSAKITAPSGRMLGAVPGRLSASSWSATDSSTPSIPATNQRRRCRLTRRWPSWRNCSKDILGSRIPFSPHLSPRSANATMPSPISRVPVAPSFRCPPIRLGMRSRISSVPKSVI